MPGWKLFTFQIPTLPKDQYGEFKQFREQYGVSSWQGIIMLIQLSMKVKREYPELQAWLSEKLAPWTKEHYPGDGFPERR